MEVELVYEVVDKASEAIERIAEKAEHLNERFEHFSEKVLEVAGAGSLLAGAFSIDKIVESTTEHIKTVRDLASITGLATEQADGMVEVFERVGMSGEEAALVMQRMSLQALRLNESMMGGEGGARQMLMNMRELKVDLRQGILPAMVSLAEQAKKGRVTTADIGRGLMIRGAEAARVFQVLRQGPEKIRDIMAEVAKSGAAVTRADVAVYNEFIAAKAEMLNAFKRVSIVVGREVLPIISRIMDTVAEHTHEWVESAKKFGAFLRDNLSAAIGLAKTLTKVMLLNHALSGFGGIVGVAGKIGGVARSAAVGAAGAAALGGAEPLSALVTGLGAGAAALGIFAAAAFFVVEGLRGIAENTAGVRDLLVETWHELVAAVQSLADVFTGGHMDEVADFFKVALPYLVAGVGSVLFALIGSIETFVLAIRNIVESVREHGIGGLRNIVSDLHDAAVEARANIEAHRKANERAAAAGELASEKRTVVNQNFPGARFDITQKFAEGFDPDRILTAFTNDLAALGERGIQSGFQPAYSGSTSKG